MPEQTRNRLGGETSPYLRQHADNPVHWQPWDEQALRLARESDRPILLSVGYSACHWCHVMAHESFEDAETAEVMNRLFVNIKVDREERPDLDRIYQTAQQLLSRQPGGWPLTMFLCGDDRAPFFGGTYFPDRARHGMPAFRDVLQKVAAYYRENRDAVREQGEAVVEVLPRLTPQPADEGVRLNDAPIRAARTLLGEAFDAEHGGFGDAPKFPQPSAVERMLRHWRLTAAGEHPDVQALFMATMTLMRMAQGGLHDQLGGGFFRYSVDRQWRIPHFEKMLCDNARLLPLYAQTWRATGDGFYRRVAAMTADWALREMRAEDGAFLTALDADSDGGEGRHYLWTPDEVRALLDPGEYAVAYRLWGLDAPANFEQRWHLGAWTDPAEVARALDQSDGTVARLGESARRKLLKARAGRARPAIDDKVLTGWNGMMISGLAVAARALEDDTLANAADQALTTLQTTVWQDGRLLAVRSGTRARYAGYLDDHAWVLDATLRLLELRWDARRLEFAASLADTLLTHFEDGEHGGFYFTADDHERLIHRLKTFTDDATPSGNAIAAQALMRLGLLLGETRWLDAAERTLRACWQGLCEHPHAHAAMLDLLEDHLNAPQTVILRGDADACAELLAVATAGYAPRRSTYFIPADAADLPPALATRAPRGPAVAYLCRGTVCSAPLESPAALARELAEGGG